MGHAQTRYPSEGSDKFGLSTQLNTTEYSSELARVSVPHSAAGLSGFERAPPPNSFIGLSAFVQVQQTYPVEGLGEFEQLPLQHPTVDQSEKGRSTFQPGVMFQDWVRLHSSRR